MTTKQITEKLTEIFRDVLDDETIELSRQTSAQDIEDWDSLNHISLLVAIEKDFSVKLDLSEVKSLLNVGDMIDLIEKKVA